MVNCRCSVIVLQALSPCCQPALPVIVRQVKPYDEDIRRVFLCYRLIIGIVFVSIEGWNVDRLCLSRRNIYIFIEVLRTYGSALHVYVGDLEGEVFNGFIGVVFQ